MDAITISSLTKDDEKEALEHLQKFLYIDEPIKNTLNSANPLEYDDVYSCLLKNDISFKAVNGDGKIVGLLINKQLFKNVSFTLFYFILAMSVLSVSNFALFVIGPQ